jgi:hypothetical protein
VLIANLVEVKTDEAQAGTSFEFYGEYGLKRGWAVVLAPSLSSAVQSPNVSWVLDEVQVGARRKIYVGKTIAISTQVSGFSIPKTQNQSERAYGVETRVAAGKSFGECLLSQVFGIFFIPNHFEQGIVNGFTIPLHEFFESFGLSVSCGDDQNAVFFCSGGCGWDEVHFGFKIIPAGAIIN